MGVDRQSQPACPDTSCPYAALCTLSTCRSQTASWFQLVRFRLTTPRLDFRTFLTDWEPVVAGARPPAAVIPFCALSATAPPIPRRARPRVRDAS